MTFAETIDQARTHLRNDLDAAFRFLENRIKKGSSVFDDFILIDGRFNRANSEFNRGILAQADKDQILNQVSSALNDLINQLVEADIHLPVNGPVDPANSPLEQAILLDKLKDKAEELDSIKDQLEQLKVENELLKSQIRKNLTLIIKCDPDIRNSFRQYTCVCTISDSASGDETEKTLRLRKGPGGGILVDIPNIKSSDYLELRIFNNEREWTSDSFTTEFFSQWLELSNTAQT